MTVPVTIGLPWPDKPLWQNKRAHWARRSNATSIARKAAWLLALEAGLRKADWIGARLAWQFIPPNRIKRDLPNVNAAMKAYTDGIADALGIDDATFRHVWPEAFSEPQKGGAIIVTVTPISRQANEAS